MLQILAKCTTYDDDVKKSRTLIKAKRLIGLLPTIALLILGVALAIAASVYCLIISAIGLLYGLIISCVLSNIFKKNNAKIVAKFVEYYHPNQNVLHTTIVDDNKGICALIRFGNPLLCWSETESLRYITSKIYNLNSLKLKSTKLTTFDAIMASDFGELHIPMGDIDHYRETTLVCRYGNDVCRLKFENEKAFETFIAQKEYYYASNKKMY